MVLPKEPDHIRRRKKREKQQETRACEERDREQSNKNAELHTTAIHSIKEEIKRQSEEGRSEKAKPTLHDLKTLKTSRVAAFASVIAAVITIFNVGVYAWLTLRTDDTANTSIGVSREQLTEMRLQRETSQLQQRAIVQSDGIIREPTVENGNILGWAIKIRWKNFGPTTAMDVLSGIGTAWVPNRSPFNDSCNLGLQTTVIGAHNIMPQSGTISVGNTLLPTGIAQRAAKGEMAIIFFSRVEYRDAFPETPKHHSEWCVNAIPPSDGDLTKDNWRFVDIVRNAD